MSTLHTLILFHDTVVVWGSTWIAIAMQVGPVAVLVSVFYRFAAAALVLIIALFVIRRLETPALRHEPFLIARAFSPFSFNFICFYTAAEYVTSGLISVVFSLAAIYNGVNARLFFGDRVTGRVVVAALMGVGGLVLLFGPDLWVGLDPKALKGIGFAALGTLFFSLGNMISRRNSAAGVSPVTTNACGAVILLAVIAAIRAATRVRRATQLGSCPSTFNQLFSPDSGRSGRAF